MVLAVEFTHWWLQNRSSFLFGARPILRALAVGFRAFAFLISQVLGGCTWPRFFQKKYQTDQKRKKNRDMSKKGEISKIWAKVRVVDCANLFVNMICLLLMDPIYGQHSMVTPFNGNLLPPVMMGGRRTSIIRILYCLVAVACINGIVFFCKSWYSINC